MSTIAEAYPELYFFLDRENGYMTLLEIIRTLRFESGEWRAQAPSVILSKKFSMARATVRNLLSHSESQGLLSRNVRGDQALTLSNAFAETLYRWVVLELTWMAGMINAAAVRLPKGSLEDRK
jgi:hypothetical protein